MTESAAALIASTPAPAVITAAAPPPVTTPASPPPVPVDYGDMLAQILADAEPIVASVASVGVPLVLSEIPLGSFFSSFVGPTIISGYVSKAFTAIIGDVSGKTIEIPSANVFETAALNLLTAGEPAAVKILGETVGPTISALVAKGLAAITPPSATTTMTAGAGTTGSGR